MTTLIDTNSKRHCHQQPHFTRTPCILCVDDDPDLQTSIELRMRKFDVELVHASYGMQGIVEATQNLPDLILLDLAMPHGNGAYLLEVLKRNQATSNIPVIVVTGMRDPSLKSRVLREGAEAFLQKPVLFDDLVHHVSRFIDLRERRSKGDLE